MISEPIKRASRIALTIYFFIIGLTFGSWASRIPDLKEKLNLSEAALGTILLMLPLGQMTMIPFSGRIAAKYGSRFVLRVAFLGYSGMLIGIGLANSPWQLALCLYCFGLCGNMGNISVNTQGVMLEKKYERPIFSSLHGIWSLGGFSGALVGLLMMRYGIAPIYHYFGIVLAVWGCNLYFQKDLLPSPPQENTLPKYKLQVPDGILLKLGLMCFFCMSVEGCMFDWTGVYFKEVIGTEEKFVSLGYAAFMITMASGRFLGDRLASTFGRKRMVVASGFFILSGLLIVVTLPYLISATIGCMLTGFGVSSIVPLLYGTAGKIESSVSSIAIATVAGIGYLGFLMGPPFIGYVAELTGLKMSFAIISISGILISLLAQKTALK